MQSPLRLPYRETRLADTYIFAFAFLLFICLFRLILCCLRMIWSHQHQRQLVLVDWCSLHLSWAALFPDTAQVLVRESGPLPLSSDSNVSCIALETLIEMTDDSPPVLKLKWQGHNTHQFLKKKLNTKFCKSTSIHKIHYLDTFFCQDFLLFVTVCVFSPLRLPLIVKVVWSLGVFAWYCSHNTITLVAGKMYSWSNMSVICTHSFNVFLHLSCLCSSACVKGLPVPSPLTYSTCTAAYLARAGSVQGRERLVGQVLYAWNVAQCSGSRIGFGLDSSSNRFCLLAIY